MSIDASTPLDFLIQRATEAAERTAIIDAGGDEPIFVSRGELLGRAVGLAEELRESGVSEGDCLAVWLPNWTDSLVWQFAAIALGAHVVGINTRYNVDEIAHVLEKARPKAVAVAHGFHKLDLRDRLHAAFAQAACPAFRVAVLTGPGKAPADVHILASYDVGAGAFVPSRQSGTVPTATDPEALAVAFTTSGSTGKPKLAAHNAGAVAAQMLAVATFDDWRETDVILCALPLTGVFSFIPAMTSIGVGGLCLLEPVFDADRIVAHMASFGVTHVIGADDIIGRIADAWNANPLPLPKWRRMLFADFNGFSKELAEWGETTFGLKAGAVYGSSESFSLMALRPPTEALPRRWQGGGTPVSKDIRVRAADPETGALKAPGETGELQIKGENIVDAYLGQPDLHAAQFTEDGWFRSGDLAIVAADGSFDYLCRIGDSLRLRGFLVEPTEIEERLLAHSAVDLAKIVGLRQSDGETVAIGFVTLAGEQQVVAEDLRQWCASGLAAYKVPQTIHIIEEMPTVAGVNGAKIKAADLREMAKALALSHSPERKETA
ncbi:AMP-binding protein [Sinorhizobium mexicanum]|uniref:Long-chain-fatty-acid--CoA ligase n=1 Tax=Sinorhizobium mexicanum TaxID=375549 RepID=A0A859QQL7_9HYPH|nr:AMP-binding protein [Sinorhizobium mexicanum]MBP1888086.1 fatty-acyl-CoA synthase [Sinorhizobium mexicanum]QLL65695.1 AMP-binding protein [Sinorhizobium mexicanum]